MLKEIKHDLVKSKEWLVDNYKENGLVDTSWKFVLFAMFKLFTFPGYFGKPGYLYLGFMILVIMNTLTALTSLLNWESGYYHWPENGFFSGLIDDGEALWNHIKS